MTKNDNNFIASSSAACINYCKCSALYRNFGASSVISARDGPTGVCNCASSLDTCGATLTGYLNLYSVKITLSDVPSVINKYKLYTGTNYLSFAYAPFKMLATPSQECTLQYQFDHRSGIRIGVTGQVLYYGGYVTTTELAPDQGANINGYSIIGTSDGQFYALNEDTGNIYYTFPTVNPVPGQTGTNLYYFYISRPTAIIKASTPAVVMWTSAY